MNFFVVGDVMLDVELKGRFRENYEGAARCVTGQQWQYHAGGAANVAAVLRWLGHRVHLFGLVGPDWAATQLEYLLSSIEYHFRALLPMTTVKLRSYADDELVVRLDSEMPVAVDWAVAACYEIGQAEGIPDCVVLSDYAKGVFGPHCEPTVRRIIQWDCPVVVDPCPCDYIQLWDGATVATPNLREAQQMEIGAQHLVVTRGADTVEVRTGEECRHVNCPTVPGAQIVGAGDAFAASLAAALAQGKDVYQAAEFAVNSATAYVSRARSEFRQ